MIEFLTNFSYYGLIIIFFCLGYGMHAFVRDILGKRDGTFRFKENHPEIGELIFNITPEEIYKKQHITIDIKHYSPMKWEAMHLNEEKLNKEDMNNARTSEQGSVL